MNREGKTYRSTRLDDNLVNGSIVLVTRSEKWSPALADEESNFTQVCLVLECPRDPSQVGREVRLDERKFNRSQYTGHLGRASTWTDDDGFVEI